MPSTTLNAFVSTIALLAGSGRAAEIKVNWRDMSLAKQAVTAGRGDIVVIDWAGTTNVHEVATKAELDNCDSSSSKSRSGNRSPTKITVPTTAANGEMFYYLSTVKDQCSKGKHFTVTVSGGEAFDNSGTCANVACRKDNDHNKGFKLDYECCALLGNQHYYEAAACAPGYTYYQHQADNCTPFGSPPNLMHRTATCCVRDGAAVPSGASLPTTTAAATTAVTTTAVATSAVTTTAVTNTDVTTTAAATSAVTTSAVTTTAVTNTDVTNTGVANTGVTNTGVANTGVTNTGVANTGVTTTGVINTGVVTTAAATTAATPSAGVPSVVNTALLLLTAAVFSFSNMV